MIEFVGTIMTVDRITIYIVQGYVNVTSWTQTVANCRAAVAVTDAKARAVVTWLGNHHPGTAHGVTNWHTKSQFVLDPAKCHPQRFNAFVTITLPM